MDDASLELLVMEEHRLADAKAAAMLSLKEVKAKEAKVREGGTHTHTHHHHHTHYAHHHTTQ